MELVPTFFRRAAPATARLDELCEFAPPATANVEDLVFWLVRLVEWLRPSKGMTASAKVRFLEARLAQHPVWRENVANAVRALVSACDVDQLLAFGGIARDFHFLGAVEEWLTSRVLPRACATRDGAEVLRLAFAEHDARWIRQTDFVHLLEGLLSDEQRSSLSTALDRAMIDLAHHVVALAHGPTVRPLSRSERSPFAHLFEAVEALLETPGDPAKVGALRGRIKQCLLALEGHRAELATRGADVNTTFQLRRMRQQLHRLAHLAEIRHQPCDGTLRDACAALVLSVHRNAAGNRLLARSSDLLVGNLVDTAADVGRTYLDEEHSSWWSAFRAGAGGGVLMALATVTKYLLARLDLPTFYEGLVYSFNYAAVFVAAYLLHFTIATKLPAHTATALARSVQEGAGHRARVGRFVEIWRAMVRLQIAGLVGNLVTVAPLAAAIELGAFHFFGRHVLTTEMGRHALHAQSLLGPSIVYAALTGFFLWISSLLGAAADNWTRVKRLEDRLATNVHVLQRFSVARARARATAVVSRIGGLVSNASLGFMLGAIPAAFAIARLPVEIRHVTVSSGSVALAVAAGVGSRHEIALAIVGVLAIGLTNVVVSFVLSLWLALRSAGSSHAAWALVRAGIRRWIRRVPTAGCSYASSAGSSPACPSGAPAPRSGARAAFAGK